MLIYLTCLLFAVDLFTANMKTKEIAVNPANYRRMAIFTYSLEHLAKKDKIRFYYAMKGRDGKSGIVKQLKIEQLGRAVLLVADKFANDVDGFLKFWK